MKTFNMGKNHLKQLLEATINLDQMRFLCNFDVQYIIGSDFKSCVTSRSKFWQTFTFRVMIDSLTSYDTLYVGLIVPLRPASFTSLEI